VFFGDFFAFAFVPWAGALGHGLDLGHGGLADGGVPGRWGS